MQAARTRRVRDGLYVSGDSELLDQQVLGSYMSKQRAK